MHARILLSTVLASIFISPAGMAQTTPRFEVASVRTTLTQTEWNSQVVGPAARAGQIPPSPLMHIAGLHVDTPGLPMKALLSAAYQIDARLIVAPDWINEGETRFAIHAVMPDGSTEAQYPEMLRALLEERFHLTTHRASVEQPAFALVTGKNGAHLKKPRALDMSACGEWLGAPGNAANQTQICRAQKVIGDRTWNIRMLTNSVYGPMYSEYVRDDFGNESHDEYLSITMPLLAKQLTEMLSTGSQFGSGTLSMIPVVDRTGIAGEWDVLLETAGGADEKLSSYNSSLEKQGLRLERTTAPVEKLIIDKVYRVPAAN